MKRTCNIIMLVNVYFPSSTMSKFKMIRMIIVLLFFNRCEIRSLWVGLLVAIPSGAGVALAVLGEYTASLVGVAISASLLPPAVNAVGISTFQ